MAANNWNANIDNVKDFHNLFDKPWRKPGADVSDYFNYGFNEDTWVVRLATSLSVPLPLVWLPSSPVSCSHAYICRCTAPSKSSCVVRAARLPYVPACAGLYRVQPPSPLCAHSTTRDAPCVDPGV